MNKRRAGSDDTGRSSAPTSPGPGHSDRCSEQRLSITLTIPVLPELEYLLAEGPTGALTFLETQFGKPLRANGLGNWFRRRCNETGLSHCSAHGLRKAGATIAADNGATAHQLMAMFGWTTLKQAEVYTKKADQKRLAGVATRLLVPSQFSAGAPLLSVKTDTAS